MKQRKSFSPPMVGGSSLLVIFAVLCLTTFTLLGLSTVQADKRLTDASVNAITAYYEADLQAETIFARIRQGEIPEEVTIDRNIYSYLCPISDTQNLVVELCQEQDSWTVLRWQAVSTLQ